MSDVQAIRGMADILHPQSALWARVEQVIRGLLEHYGYQEIRIPIVERTELFRRSIGEVTDIVEKEMYTFDDRNGVSLTLRPEATAGVVRAAITNGLLHNQRHRLWTSGPMFRYEKPQKGRYRQFHQVSVEALGYPGPDIDAELILMTVRLWRRLGIEDLELQLNSLGTPQARAGYMAALREYFSRHEASLDEDSRRRLDRNPMRILDSKNPQMQEIVAGAPEIRSWLDPESAAHFAALCALLDEAGVAYRLNSRLVRGLDYYSRTVFEWVTDRLGTQGAVCSGGRYDGLVGQLGAPQTPAVGWALGMERLVELYGLGGGQPADVAPQVYVVAIGDAAWPSALLLAEALRDGPRPLRVEAHCGGGGLKAQMRRADRSGAAVAVILGEDELASGQAVVKPLRLDREQQSLPREAVAAHVAALLEEAR
ncbi:MAG: histidine--tRNA ligase [Chromatiales bacterium]|nr:histidine--tRNA ligase [Chromatiales bacterium]